jgi:hypothetical protein
MRASLPRSAAMPASVAAGFLWKSIGHSAPFFYGAATAVIAAILLGVLIKPGEFASDSPA